MEKSVADHEMVDSSHTALRRKVEALQRASSSPSKTPSPAPPDWHSNLSTASQIIQPMVFDATTLRHRADLLRALKSAHHQPSIWRDYLNILNNARKAYIRQKPEDMTHHIRMFHALQTLYEKATTVVPMSAANRHSPIYTQLWIDLAVLRAEDDPEDANVIFKRLKSQRIGQSLPLFWNAWADLALRQKNHERAVRLRREAAACAGVGPATPTQPGAGAQSRLDGTQMNTFSSQLRSRNKAPFRPARRVLDPPPDPLFSTDESNVMQLSSSKAARTPGHSPNSLSHGTPSISQDVTKSRHALKLQQSSQRLVESSARSALPRVSSYELESRQTPYNSRSPEMLRSHAVLEREQSSPEVFSSPDEPTSLQPHQDEANENGPKDVFADTKIPSGSDNTNKSLREELSSGHREWNLAHEVEREEQNKKSSLQDVALGKVSKLGCERDLPLNRKVSDRKRGVVGQGELDFDSERKQSLGTILEVAHPGTEDPVLERTRYSRHPSHAFGPASVDRTNSESSGRPIWRERTMQTREGGAASNSELNHMGRTRLRHDPEKENGHLSGRLPPRAEHISPPRSTHNSDGDSYNTISASKRQDWKQESDIGRSQVLRFLGGIRPESVVTVNSRPYLILEQVGKGGSSKVFKVLSQDMKVLALKRVKVPLTSHFRTTVDSYANEIALLRKLHGSPTIIQLFDAEVRRECGMIQMIMEYGDTDLAKLLSRRKNRKINDNFIRMNWQQMLEAVHTIHEARIIHGDLKPANFLVVGGSLKLIDFGIAKAIVADDTTKVLRDSQVGTPNYMSPEALMCEDDGSDDESTGEEDTHKGGERRTKARRYKVGRGSDIWSLGCILYQMVHGRTPFAHIKNTLQKLSCIQDPKYEISYRNIVSATVLEVLKGCLQRNPENRMSIPELLRHRFVCPENDNARAHTGGYMRDMSVALDDTRAGVNGFFDILQRQGVEGMIISGQAVLFNRGDVTLEKILNDVARDATRVLPGIGFTTSMGTEVNLSGRRDQRGQPWKGLTTPTASVVTPFGTSAKASEMQV